MPKKKTTKRKAAPRKKAPQPESDFEPLSFGIEPEHRQLSQTIRIELQKTSGDDDAPETMWIETTLLDVANTTAEVRREHRGIDPASNEFSRLACSAMARSQNNALYTLLPSQLDDILRHVVRLQRALKKKSSDTSSSTATD